jgi:hypothetical protein
MPSWKKIITSGSSAALGSLQVSDNVGIGTAISSERRIDIDGGEVRVGRSSSGTGAWLAVNLTNGTTASAAGSFSIRSSASNTEIIPTTQPNLVLNRGSDTLGTLIKLTNQRAGFAGIGSTATADNLHDIRLYSGDGSERIRINSSGSVGIGTTSPNATLDVNGNVRATSFTGSLQGSASYALTASFALNAAGGAAFPFSGSAVITGSLDITGNATVQSSLSISQALLERAEITVSASGVYTIYSAPTSSYRGIFADYTLVSTSPSGNARAGNIMSILSGSQVRYTETRTTDIGSTAGTTVQVNLSGGNLNLELNVATVTTTWNLVSLVRTI